VVAYDYSGYGESEGTYSEEELCNDIEEIADYVNNSLLIPYKNIIV